MNAFADTMHDVVPEVQSPRQAWGTNSSSLCKPSAFIAVFLCCMVVTFLQLLVLRIKQQKAHAELQATT